MARCGPPSGGKSKWLGAGVVAWFVIFVFSGLVYATPVAYFRWDSNTSNGCGWVQFTNESYRTESGRLTYRWQFGVGYGAGTPIAAKDPLMNYECGPCSYEVKLTVRNQTTGETDTYTDTVRITCSSGFRPTLKYPEVRRHNSDDDIYASICYSDRDGGDPVVHQIVIDGEPRELIKSWGCGINGRLYKNWFWNFEPGPHSYYFEFTDSSGMSVTYPENTAGPLWFTTAAPNAKPVATGASYTVPENDDLEVTLDASDDDADDLEFRLVSGPTYGTLDWSSAPVVIYSPNPYYSGADSFRFEAYDGNDLSDPATIQITVIDRNFPPEATSDPSQSTDKNAATSFGLLASDPDGDPLTYRILDRPDHGSLSAPDASGNVTYEPVHDWTGVDQFDFKANDGKLDSNVATVTIAVSEVPNRSPTAYPANRQTDVDSALVIELEGYDPDRDTLDFQVVTGPVEGSLSGLARVDDDTFEVTYSPGAGYSGPDSFVFEVDDGEGGADQATISITVGGTNHAPSADPKTGPDRVVTQEDTSVDVVLSGDDPDGDPLAFVKLTDPSYGMLSGSAPNYLYTPLKNYNSQAPRERDSFTYQTTDGSLVSNVATVEIEIAAVNDPPDAQGQDLETPRNVDLAITLFADDADGDAITYSIVSPPVEGTLIGLDPATGTLTYRPQTNYRGTDQFTFEADDSHPGGTSQAVVRIDVGGMNPAPIALFSSTRDAGYPGMMFDFDGADSYDPDGESLISYQWNFGDGKTASGVTTSHVFEDTGEYRVQLTVTESGGKTATATRTITITRAPPDQSPIAKFKWTPIAPETGDTVRFDASRSYDPESYGFVSYLWDFGDGSSGFGMEASYRFRAAGWYDVALTVITSDNRRDTKTQRVHVGEEVEPPSPPDEPRPPEPLDPLVQPEILNAERLEDNSVLIEWQGPSPWAGYTEIQRRLSTSSAGFEAVGTVCRELRWIDRDVVPDRFYTYRVVNFADAKTFLMSDEFTVGKGLFAPNAWFSCSRYDPVVGEAVVLDATAARDYDGEITSYTWADMHGVISHEIVLEIRFDQPGEHIISLTVEDNDGLSGQQSITIDVIDIEELFRGESVGWGYPDSPLHDQPKSFSVVDYTSGNVYRVVFPSEEWIRELRSRGLLWSDAYNYGGLLIDVLILDSDFRPVEDETLIRQILAYVVYVESVIDSPLSSIETWKELDEIFGNIEWATTTMDGLEFVMHVGASLLGTLTATVTTGGTVTVAAGAVMVGKAVLGELLGSYIEGAVNPEAQLLAKMQLGVTRCHEALEDWIYMAENPWRRSLEDVWRGILSEFWIAVKDEVLDVEQALYDRKREGLLFDLAFEAAGGFLLEELTQALPLEKIYQTVGDEAAWTELVAEFSSNEDLVKKVAEGLGEGAKLVAEVGIDVALQSLLNTAKATVDSAGLLIGGATEAFRAAQIPDWAHERLLEIEVFASSLENLNRLAPGLSREIPAFRRLLQAVERKMEDLSKEISAMIEKHGSLQQDLLESYRSLTGGE